jgi:predicted metalloendopeptidase
MMLNRDDLRDVKLIYHNTNLKTLQHKYPNIQFDKFINSSNRLIIQQDINNDFFSKLNTYILTLDIDKLKNYIKWVIINELLPYYSLEVNEMFFSFYNNYLQG